MLYTMSTNSINVSNLTKKFTFTTKNESSGWIKNLFSPETKEIIAVDDISFSVKHGERVAFIGPNGAGKTTTFYMLVGLIKSNSGTITINDDEYSNYINQVDFIQKYIFPGGVLPSKKILYKLFKENNFELYEEKSFGKDYAKTLRIWKENFNNSWNDISKIGFDEKFKNLWNYYLSYCETGFDTEHTDVSQFYLKKII